MISLLNCGFFSYAKKQDRENQDFYALPKPLGNGFMFAVADGVGSYPGAKEAAEQAIAAISTIDAENITDMQVALSHVKHCVDKMAESRQEWTYAATTLSFCFIDSDAMYVGHIGDTRVYVKSGNKLKLLTKDHTQHQELLDDGIYTKRELRDMPGKSTLTAAVSRNIPLRFQSIRLPLSEIIDGNGLVNIYIMSDGAHHFWEKRPRLSLNTLEKTPKFAASLLRRIENSEPIDDHTLIAASFFVKK